MDMGDNDITGDIDDMNPPASQGNAHRQALPVPAQSNAHQHAAPVPAQSNARQQAAPVPAQSGIISFDITRAVPGTQEHYRELLHHSSALVYVGNTCIHPAYDKKRNALDWYTPVHSAFTTIGGTERFDASAVLYFQYLTATQLTPRIRIGREKFMGHSEAASATSITGAFHKSHITAYRGLMLYVPTACCS
jgi:hypothetical protein